MGEDFEEKKTNADFPIRPFNKEFSSFAKCFLFFEKTVGDRISVNEAGISPHF